MSGIQLSRVTAVLVRAPALPEGDPGCGVEFDLCLDARGQIETGGPPDSPWPVRRYWRDREDWHGALVSTPQGWAIRGISEDAPVWGLRARVLRPGEYLTLVEPSRGEMQFRIVNVTAL